MKFTQRTKKASEIPNVIDRMAKKHRIWKVTWEKSGPAEHAQAGQLSGLIRGQHWCEEMGSGTHRTSTGFPTICSGAGFGDYHLLGVSSQVLSQKESSV